MKKNKRNNYWKQLLASLACKINTNRNSVKNVVTSKGIEVGIEWKEVK